MKAISFANPMYQGAFDRDGIVQVPFLDHEEIKALIAVYEDMSKGISDRMFHSTMFINDPTYRKETGSAIQKIISPRISSVFDHYRILFSNFIVKEPSGETRVGIHQDWNFTLPEYTSINIWVPLVDIDRKTGIFHALKGSHKTFRNIRYTPYPDDLYARLEKYILQNSAPYQIKAGEAIIYHGALVHFSDANLSNDKRIAIGSVLIPDQAPALHYYKRNPDRRTLEVYETNETFYNGFNFFEEPKGVTKIKEINEYYDLPSEEDLISIQ